MAHTLRTEDARHDDVQTLDGDGESICIDLRHGDLSDDEVVSLLLQIARDRAAQPGDVPTPSIAPSAAHPPTTFVPSGRGAHAVGTGARWLARVHSRRRWLLPALAIVAFVFVTAVLAFAVRSRDSAATVTASAGGETPPSAAPASTTPSSVRSGKPTPSSTAVPNGATGAVGAVGGAGTEAQRTAAFCEAIDVYTLDNLVTLAENGVRDPRGTITAYATMVANAPPGIADDVTALGPVTGKVQAEIEAGRITTPQQMQQYLAGGAPSDEVARWIVAQQAVVAELPALCPEHGRP